VLTSRSPTVQRLCGFAQAAVHGFGTWVPYGDLGGEDHRDHDSEGNQMEELLAKLFVTALIALAEIAVKHVLQRMRPVPAA